MIDSAVILAIGTTTHKSQLIQQRPRAMLPALGKPMVVRVMDRLYRAGIRRYIVVLGISEGAVASYLNRQWLPDASIEFTIKTENDTLGTVLAKIARQLKSPFIIASYNSFTYERFASTLVRQHDEHPDDFIIAGAHLSLSQDAENAYAITDEFIVQQITTEKPTDERPFMLTDHAVLGHAVVEYLAALEGRRAARFGNTLSDIAAAYIQNGNTVRIGETSWILRVESDRDLLTLNKRLLEDSNDAHILSELPYTVKIIAPVRIDPQVSVGQGVTLGPHVYIERGASIGYNTTLSNTIVMEDSSVPSDQMIENSIVTGSSVIDL